jgi:predicted RNase H-like HicB family nuclease
MIRQIKVVVEKYPGGYVAYPLGFKGVVVGEGETHETALADVKSAISFHTETFDPDGSQTPLIMPTHRIIKGPTLSTILTQSGIPREGFL